MTWNLQCITDPQPCVWARNGRLLRSPIVVLSSVYEARTRTISPPPWRATLHSALITLELALAI